MKNKYNTLRQYIYEYSQREYRKKTVNGLFRAILEPVVSNQKFESAIFLRLLDDDEKKAYIQRLSFSGAKIYGFSPFVEKFNIKDIQKDASLWGDTEFIIVTGQRYSACLIWDYSQSQYPDASNVCFLYNSKIITDILKCINNNSNEKLDEIINKFSPDRRENVILNSSINFLAGMLNDKNDEIIFSSIEKNNYDIDDETRITAKLVSEKAKYISHEIKNNLSVINLYSKILEKRLQKITLDDEIQDSINTSVKNIENASENISSLISDLRCVSLPYLIELNIKAVILQVVQSCKLKAESKGVTIKTEDFKDIILTTDKTKFECALMNILYNAVEACSKGCEIKISCKEEENRLKVIVENNGEMIPKESVSLIFKPEYTTKEKGSGLGLAICRNQLETVGGNINLVSSDEKSTIFEIVLPSNSSV